MTNQTFDPEPDLERSVSAEKLDDTASKQDATPRTAKPQVYARRWFGLVQLALLNMILAFNGLNYAAVPEISMRLFQIDLSAINLLSTGFLVGFVIASPFSVWILNHGPKPAMLVAGALLILGNWIRYAGTQRRQFRVVVGGQMFISLAQPIILAAPTTYSEMWFREKARVPATAATSLAMLLGTALSQLITPTLVKAPEDLPRMVLITAFISSVAVFPTAFVSAKPPTPASTKDLNRPTFLISVKLLFSNRYFWFSYVILGMLMGIFSAFSSLLPQTLLPYGFSESQAGLGGAVLVFAGLAMAAVATPIIGHYRKQVISIKVLVPAVGISFAVFYSAPLSKSLPVAYLILALLGSTSLVLLPVMLEYLTDVTTPVSPQISSVVVWTTSQIIGAIFLLVMNALKDAKGSMGPKDNYQKAVILLAAMGFTVVPLCFLLK